MRTETFTEERLIERKGIILKLHLEYILRYAFIFLLCYGLYKSNLLFGEMSVGIFTDRPHLVISALKLTAFTLLFVNIIENIIYNFTLMDENNKWYLTIQHSLSVFLGIYLSSKFIPDMMIGSIFGILIISIYLGLLKAQFKMKYFDIVDFITLVIVFVTAHLYSYGLHFNGWINAGIVLSVIFIAVLISQKIYANIISKNVLKSPFKKRGYFYVLTQAFVLVLMYLLVAGCTLFVFDKLGIIKIYSYLQVLSLFVFYVLLQFNLNYSWSKTHKKTQSNSYSRTYSYR